MELVQPCQRDWVPGFRVGGLEVLAFSVQDLAFWALGFQGLGFWGLRY